MAAFCLVIGLSFALRTGGAVAQTTPTITISSPIDGTVIKPGQTLTVAVSGSSIPSNGIENITLSEELGIISSTETAANSNTFTVTVPVNIEPGSYYLRAVATFPSGLIVSPTISVKVLPTYNFDSLKMNLHTVILNGPREKAKLLVDGITSNSLKIIKNEFIIFKSANPAVATVDADGFVTPISRGTTQISATYGNLTANTNVIVGGSFTDQGTSTAPASSPPK